MNKIYIYINGQKKLVNNNSSLYNILNIFNIDLKKIAIEINEKVIPKSLYKTTILKNEDKIEIVQFIGGG